MMELIKKNQSAINELVDDNCFEEFESNNVFKIFNTIGIESALNGLKNHYNLVIYFNKMIDNSVCVSLSLEYNVMEEGVVDKSSINLDNKEKAKSDFESTIKDWEVDYKKPLENGISFIDKVFALIEKLSESGTEVKVV